MDPMATAYSGTIAAVTAAAALLSEDPTLDFAVLKHLDEEVKHLRVPIGNAAGRHDLTNGEPIDRAIVENYFELPEAPTRFLEIKNLVDDLVVLKVVRSHLSVPEDYVSNQITPVADQIKALNRFYGVRIPFVICAPVATRKYVFDVAKRLSTSTLEIRVLTQSVFPVVEMRNGNMYLDAEARSVEEMWYEPGDGNVLSRISGNPLFAALSKGKKILMFLGAETCPPIIDTRILSFMTKFEVEFCLESMLGKHILENGKFMDSVMTMRVGETLKVLDRGQAEAVLRPETFPLHYWSTNIMWVKLDTLNHLFNYNMLNRNVSGSHMFANTITRTQITTRAASAAEIFNKCTVVDVPHRRKVFRTSDLLHLQFLHYLMNPTFTHHLRPSILVSVVLFYILYHAVLVLVGVFLHDKIGSREMRTWLEGVIWVIILLIYIFILYTWRSRRFEYPLDPESRRKELRADYFQLALHGVSRCIYLGLTATAEEREWFKDRHWVMLSIIHSAVAFIKIPCSYLIELKIGSGFREPAEI